jgi:hypothetical protein
MKPTDNTISTMTKDEKLLLHSYMGSCLNYLEFGSGESTIYASNVSTIQTIKSVESSKKYIDKNLKHNPIIANALLTGKLVFHLIDIGETKKWGYPINDKKRHLFPNYSLSVFSQPNDYDLVLVDGRFRVACTVSTILNTQQTCIIIIHDFWNRPEYHIVLRYLETLDRVDTLGVFRKKRNIDSKQLQLLLKTYQYLPGDRPITRQAVPKQNKTKNYNHCNHNIKSSNYIFVIGFNKTGTTSIHKLFENNGFSSIHWDGGRLAKNMLQNGINYRPIFHGYDQQYTVYSDMIYRTDKFWFEGNSLFKEMHTDYPNALFLYNTRDCNSWLQSRLNHKGQVIGQSFLDIHKRILKTEDTDLILQHWKKTRIRFEKDIREYFKNSKNFLEIDITDSMFVSKLSAFIGVELNQGAFPLSRPSCVSSSLITKHDICEEII